MKYTPGPWRMEIKHFTSIGNYRVIGKRDPGQVGFAVAQIHNPSLEGVKTEELLANAKLITASPELYEELVEADEVICELCKRLNPQHKDCTECQDRESRLKVIAKVKGGERNHARQA